MTEPNSQGDGHARKDLSKSRSLLRSGAVVSAMTMLSRIFGLLRDVVLARVLGAGAEADAFFVAFKIPNFFRRLFAEGAFSQAFVPVLSEYREAGSQEAARLLIAKVAGNLGSILIALTVIVVVASPLLAGLFGMGFLLSGDHSSFWLTSDLLRITFPYLFFISITGLCSAVLNCYDRFAVPAFTPVLLNISLILAALFLAPQFGDSTRAAVFALAWGVFIAGCVQMAFQLPFLARIHMLPKPAIDWQDSGVRKILTLMVPALFGVSIAQINLLLDTIIATFLPAGSVSWLYFSDRLTELPLGVFGVGIATVVLPALSRSFVTIRDNNRDQDRMLYSDTLNWGLRIIFLIGIPATVALTIISKPVLILLFYYDAMQLSDIEMSSLSLRAYALGLTGFMAVKVLASGFYARQDMKTPVKIGVIALISNMVLNLLFVVPLYHFYDIGHVGLALATSCSAALNASLLCMALRRQNAFFPKGWARFLLQLGFASILMAAVLHMLTNAMQDFHELTLLWRLANVGALIAAGGLTLLAALFIAGFRLADLRQPVVANTPD